MSNLDSLFSQYEKNQAGGAKKLSQEDRMKRYFTLLLNDKENTGQRTIRILPTEDGSSPFKEAWFHELQVGGFYQKIYDPAGNDNEASPLNDVYNALRATKRKDDEELAKDYRARMYYIVKVIDRANEQDGPKYWRFKHSYKKDGIIDKIIPIVRNKGDIFDIETGRDLIIDLVKTKSPKGKDYTSVATIMYDDPSPLSTDAELAKKWATDESTWKDVYTRKPLEYLEAISRGESPRWDDSQGKYVYLNSVNSEASFGGATVAKNATVKEGKVDAPQVDALDTDDADDDLPF
jgi:hypothetical protein